MTTLTPEENMKKKVKSARGVLEELAESFWDKEDRVTYYAIHYAMDKLTDAIESYDSPLNHVTTNKQQYYELNKLVDKAAE